nr:MAG TPA: hypothetical protein [Caudoviricetes sp.]
MQYIVILIFIYAIKNFKFRTICYIYFSKSISTKFF